MKLIEISNEKMCQQVYIYKADDKLILNESNNSNNGSRKNSNVQI